MVIADRAHWAIEIPLAAWSDVGQIRLSPRPLRCRSGATGSPPIPDSVAAVAWISGLCPQHAAAARRHELHRGRRCGDGSASALRANRGCSRRRSKMAINARPQWPHDALARPFTTNCSGGRVGPTSNASADQSPIAGLFADAAARGAGRMADAGRRAAARTAALRSLVSTAPWPG